MRKMQIKTTARDHYPPMRWAKIERKLTQRSLKEANHPELSDCF